MEDVSLGDRWVCLDYALARPPPAPSPPVQGRIQHTRQAHATNRSFGSGEPWSTRGPADAGVTFRSWEKRGNPNRLMPVKRAG